MPRIRNEPNDSIDTLFQAVLSLRDLDECYRFFGDLLTVQELAAFARPTRPSAPRLPPAAPPSPG